jgi:hypothetical protein
MGDISRGHTFSGSPATATTTDVHNLVDDATINALAVTTAKLANNAVDATKLADDTVTNLKLSTYVDTVGGSADAIELTPASSYAAYVEGDVFAFKATGNNTGAAMTVNVKALGTKTLVDELGRQSLPAGTIRNGRIYMIRYDGSFFQLIDTGRPERVWHAPTVSGTDALTLSFSGFAGPLALTAGLMIEFEAVAANTGAVTINPGGLGATDLKKNHDEDLAAGDLQNGQRVLAVYDGSVFQVLSNLDLARCASATLDFDADSVFFKDAGDSNVKQGPASVLQPKVKVAVLEHQLTAGTHGGSATAGVWTNRVLNTEVSDADSIVTLSSNLFTPVAGTYLVRARAAFYDTDATRLRIYNDTAGSTAVLGLKDRMSTVNSATGLMAVVEGVFTANGTDAFSLDYRCTTGTATYGLGFFGTNDGDVEVFAQVVLTKIA